MASEDKESGEDYSVHKVMAEVQAEFLRFLVYKLGNRDEAADVLQNFYVRVLDRIDDVRDSEKLRGWMRKVLHTTLIDYYRTQGKRRVIEKEYANFEKLMDSEEAEHELDRMICICLYQLLPTLKSDYADILWRIDIVGEARESVSASLDISESNLRVRLHRARHALRDRLKETCETCPVHGFLNCDCSHATHAAPLD
ncbi:MAG: sigma-70 family RNA polymerase sigma factor [Parasphingorhabdus sp.]|uniref:RNA polymerase sigma factor n=1 Tax=Parasphingorhabdus sp. TaxID=2709688 RepID=UPI0030020759